jgi:hypothetical protein
MPRKNRLIVRKNRVVVAAVGFMLLLIVAAAHGSSTAENWHPQSEHQTTPASSNVQEHDKNLIKVIAVGDVMLGSSFPDDSGLPPNDGADLLRDVTPLLAPGGRCVWQSRGTFGGWRQDQEMWQEDWNLLCISSSDEIWNLFEVCGLYGDGAGE